MPEELTEITTMAASSFDWQGCRTVGFAYVCAKTTRLPRMTEAQVSRAATLLATGRPGRSSHWVPALALGSVPVSRPGRPDQGQGSWPRLQANAALRSFEALLKSKASRSTYDLGTGSSRRVGPDHRCCSASDDLQRPPGAADLSRRPCRALRVRPPPSMFCRPKQQCHLGGMPFFARCCAGIDANHRKVKR